MPYTDSLIDCIGISETDGATLGYAKNVTAVCLVKQPCDLYAVGVLIRVVTDSDIATCTVTSRVIPASDAGALAVATLTIPVGTAAGAIIWQEPEVVTGAPGALKSLKLMPGYELKFVFSNNGGAVYWKPWFEAYPRPEVKQNMANFAQSTT